MISVPVFAFQTRAVRSYDVVTIWQRRVAGGPGPSRRPHRRVSIIALVPPDLLGAARFGAASDWRRVPCRARCSRNHRVRAVAWRRQRHDHDREGHFAIGIADAFAFTT